MAEWYKRIGTETLVAQKGKEHPWMTEFIVQLMNNEQEMLIEKELNGLLNYEKINLS